MEFNLKEFYYKAFKSTYTCMRFATSNLQYSSHDFFATTDLIFKSKTYKYNINFMLHETVSSQQVKTRLGQLGANISPDRSSLTPQVLIGNFLKHNYPLLYELQHINLLCLYLPKEDGVSPDTEYITQIIFSIFLQ